ncbi:DUF3891 family protein [Paenibacillus sp. GXUN7292]|uniref:DUF3891 family protein n=1 Tax=Paenibacillus sp. GXUN7292 TaxID=3422499 RepID=UPI003D7DF758
MIIRETEHHFVMTTQHEHASFSGKVASCFKENLFLDSSYMSDVLIAIKEHDRGWIRLDDTPVWNDRHMAPCSFGEYPLLPKLVLYRKGLDEIEQINQYAALICSMHFSSFKHLQQSKQTECIDFIHHETERQKRIKAGLTHPGENIVERHFKLLQLSDEISLYVCFNRPGAAKEEEHPWYRAGFETIIDGQKINARWANSKEIVISPFLFEKEFTASIKIKYVAKDFINQIGLSAAYQETDLTEQVVTFRAGENNRKLNQ